MYSVSTKTSAHRRKPPEDLGLLTNNKAIIFPALQPFNTNLVNDKRAKKLLAYAGYKTFDILNFQHTDGLFHYPFALLSAGNANLNVSASQVQVSLAWERNLPKTVTFLDSGGFSCAAGELPVQEYFRRRHQLWAWQSAFAQTGPTIVAGMDLPTAAFRNGIPGIGSYRNCLLRTESNILDQVKARIAGQYRLLNVIQGMSGGYGPRSLIHWYRHMRHLNEVSQWGDSACEGWAVGGLWWLEPSDLLFLLWVMHRDGALAGRNCWLHIFGVTEARMVAIFSLIQKALRIELKDPNFTISCDSSNPTKSMGKGGSRYLGTGNVVATRRLPDRSLKTDGFHRFPLLFVDEEVFPYTTAVPYSGFAPWQVLATKELLEGTVLEGTPLHSAHVLQGDKENGGLSPLGQLAFSFANTEAFLRQTYAFVDRYLAKTERDFVPLIISMLRSDKPEEWLPRIIFP